MSLIGLDIGTTGCKCMIFDIEGNVQSFSYKEYSVEDCGQGQYELDPYKVWQAVKYVIYNAVKNNKGDNPIALSVSSFGESATPVDKNGNILYNSILYTDNRGLEQSQKLLGKLEEIEIFKLTGVPVHPMYTINKVAWIKENMPDIFNNTWKFMLFEDLIIYFLTGTPMIDYSLASRTMAFNVVKKEWEPVIFDIMGVDIDIFSKVSHSGTIVGNIRESLANELQLPPALVVVTGGHDQACAALGAGILEEGQAVEGIGTADCITTVFDKPILNNEMLKSNFNCEPHALDEKYISLAFTLTGGALLKWYRNCFGREYTVEAIKNKMSVYKLLDEKAAKEPTDLIVLPHFSGSGTPYMDPMSKGAIIGLTLDSTPSRLYRALMEGVAYEMRYNIECLEKAGIQVRKLRAVGGGAKSDLWLQIKADITGKSIETLNIDEAGTLAAAVIAGTAIGLYTSYESAVNKIVKAGKKFYPNPKHQEIYEVYYHRYKKTYKAVKSIYDIKEYDR